MRITVITATAVLLLGFQNCAKTNFSGTLGDSPTQTFSVVDPLPTTPDGPIICDPLGGGQSASDKNGLVGNLFYVPVADQSSSFKSLADVQQKAKLANGTIYMSQINVPTRAFTEGFVATGGEPLKDDQGNKLIEYFGLKMQTELALTDADDEGVYQLATISDDGMVVYAGSDSAPQIVAGKFDQIHSTRSDCGEVTFTLRKGDRLPLNVVYYQGPKTQIAAVWAWRKVADPAQLDAKGCGITKDNSTFFATTSDGSGPWEQMVSAGWRVIPSNNLWLPKTAAVNPCAP